MQIKGKLNEIPDNAFIGFDAEWTKNYKIKNGNIPFCFSIVVMERNVLNFKQLEDGNVCFDYIQYYCESPTEFRELVISAESWISKILKKLNTCILCGHQISSDFSVLHNIGIAYDIKPLECFELIRNEWKQRKTVESRHIIDTRYDIFQDFLGKSRRLVDMCNDFCLDVTQPELKKSSMTKLQNDFYNTHDENILERIAVMNLRHSLCAIILSWLNNNIREPEQRKILNINKTVYKNLKEDFSWVRSKEFYALLCK